MSRRNPQPLQMAPPRPPLSSSSAIAFAVLATYVLVVYGRSLDAPFVFDDTGSVMTNESIRQLWPLVGSAEHPAPLSPPKFSSTAGRPLVNLSLALNYHFNQLRPTGYHLFNVVVHLLSALLLWAIVRRTLRLPFLSGRFDRVAGPLALIVAVLWAVHPLNTEAVIYVTQRTELMVAFFFLATLYASLRYWTTDASRPRTTWLTLAVFASAAGMATKEVMVAAPVVVLLYERTFLTRTFAAALRRSWPLYLCLASGWLVLAYLNVDRPRGDSAGFHLGVNPFAWWFTQAKVLLMYLKLALWPWPLVIHYEMPYLASLSEAWMYVVPVVLLVAASLYLLWRGSAAGFLAVCVFAILAPTLIVPITTEVAAERRMYLPLAALVTLAVVGAYSLVERYQRSRAANARTSHGESKFPVAIAVSAALLAIVYCAVSQERLAAYDQQTLWADAVAYDPRNALAQLNLAVQLDNAGHVAEAIERYRTAIELNPNAVESHYSLGLALLKTSQPEAAIAAFRETVRIKPTSDKMRNNLGVALVHAGRHAEAIDVFRQTLELNPDMWKAHDNLALALQHEGRLPEAVEHYERALAINPAALEIYGHLADSYAKANQPDEAIAVAERALAAARAAGNHALAEQIAVQLESFRASKSKTSNPAANPLNPAAGR